MKVFGIAGWSGAGKTTLLSKLIPELTKRGLSVSTIKHTHHSVEIDKPGKDSHTHRQAGATEVLVGSPKRWALIHENRGAPELDLDALIARMTPVDLLLVEGFRAYPHDKLEIYRAGNEKSLLCQNDPHIIAVASDSPLTGLEQPIFDINDIMGLADFILAHCKITPDSK